MANKHTISDLYQMQSLSLQAKIQMTKRRISEWVDEFGEDEIYVSFSGGKDSTVLLDIVRKDYPNVKAVFVDTGLEYPEIRSFVKGFENVDWIKPKMTFKKVIEKYGYPIISKEVSKIIYGARHSKDKKQSYIKKLKGLNPDGSYSEYKQQYKKYEFLLQAPFEISNRCCVKMKEQPAMRYENKTGEKPIVATMAEESKQRLAGWCKTGCNAFDSERQMSKPISFWTEQDVLLYIYENKLPIASVYGDVVIDYEAMGQVEGQMDMSQLASEFGVFDIGRPILKTTGVNRTGCMFCGYGCHLEKSPNRFERMKETHPKQYNYIMKPVSDGGLGYKEIIDWINEHGNMNIKY